MQHSKQYVKGVQFVNKRLPFRSKMVYTCKKGRGWTSGRSRPVWNFLEYPLPREGGMLFQSRGDCMVANYTLKSLYFWHIQRKSINLYTDIVYFSFHTPLHWRSINLPWFLFFIMHMLGGLWRENRASVNRLKIYLILNHSKAGVPCKFIMIINSIHCWNFWVWSLCQLSCFIFTIIITHGYWTRWTSMLFWWRPKTKEW